MSNFILKHLHVWDKNTNIFEIDFLSNFAESNKPFSTIIIGQNGTGKSYLLKLIVQIFRELESYQKNEKANFASCKNFKLIYQIDSTEFSITRLGRESNYEIIKNNIEVGSSFVLPTKVLSVSFMVNDKFHFVKDSDEQSFYEYVGVRQTSNAAWTTTIEKNLSNLLIKNGIKHKYSTRIKNILSFLEYETRFSIVFRLQRKALYFESITKEFLQETISKLIERRDFRSEKIERFNDNEVNLLINFINNRFKQLEHYKKGPYSYVSYNNNLNEKEDEAFLNDYHYLELLIDLQLISSPSLKFFKIDSFDFENTSSGEKHFLYTMISIASKIEANSLILIDEPEISLHPNWQTRYVSELKNTLIDFNSCHFILASHSHFMVSDLEKESSSVVSLSIETTKKEFSRKSKLIQADTYGWSIENILYEIFQIKTTRNYYLEQDLNELLELISNKNENRKRIDEILSKVRSIDLTKNDPLNNIISKIDKILKND